MHCSSHTVHVRQTRLIVLQNLKEVLTEPIGGLPKKKKKKKKNLHRACRKYLYSAVLVKDNTFRGK